jgi:hypothetical protein
MEIFCFEILFRIILKYCLCYKIMLLNVDNEYCQYMVLSNAVVKDNY